MYLRKLVCLTLVILAVLAIPVGALVLPKSPCQVLVAEGPMPPPPPPW